MTWNAAQFEQWCHEQEDPGKQLRAMAGLTSDQRCGHRKRYGKRYGDRYLFTVKVGNALQYLRPVAALPPVPQFHPTGLHRKSGGAQWRDLCVDALSWEPARGSPAE